MGYPMISKLSEKVFNQTQDPSIVFSYAVFVTFVVLCFTFMSLIHF